MSLAHLLLPLLLAPAGAAFPLATSHPDAPNCTEAMTQQAMNRCAAEEYAAADADLNRQWRLTAAQMRQLDETVSLQDGRPGYFVQLRSAQRAWLGYRDAHCSSVGYSARGGSLEALLVADCKTRLTRTRTEQLRDLADGPR